MREVKKMDNGVWLGIWVEYHSGAAGKSAAMLKALDELEHMIAGLVTQAKSCAGHLSTDHEDFKQSLYVKLFELLETYDPSRGKFSTYAYKDLQSLMSKYRLGGDGFMEPPVSLYNAKKGRLVHQESYERLLEDEETRNYLHSRASSPSAEDIFFDSMISEDIVDFKEYIDGLDLSLKEKKEKWRLFMGLRGLKF